jgi:SulP family sulfate permease
MSEWRTFRAMLTAPRSDVAVLLVTFFLTVLVDITVALGVGMVLASFLFMRKMAEVTNITAMTEMFADDQADANDPNAVARRAIPAGVEVYEIDGPFFFGAAEKFKETIGSMAKPPSVLILRMRKVGLLDATGLALIKDLVKKERKDKTTLVLSGVHSQPMVALTNSDLLDEIGEDNFVGDIDEALARARDIVAAKTAAAGKR